MRKKALLIFVMGAAVGGSSTYLWLSYAHGTGLFEANRVRWRYAPTEGDRKWAEPLQAPGLTNFHRVRPDLYRGAQPTAEGISQLKGMGVRTVVNLRSFHSDRDLIGETGLGYEHIYMKARHAEDKEVVRFLQIVTEESRTPVFVHCQFGSDRTGLMCAVYRVFICGWSKDEAIAEMTEGGFGFHRSFDNLVEYLEELDVDAMSTRAGITTGPARQRGAAASSSAPSAM